MFVPYYPWQQYIPYLQLDMVVKLERILGILKKAVVISGLPTKIQIIWECKKTFQRVLARCFKGHFSYLPFHMTSFLKLVDNSFHTNFLSFFFQRKHPFSSQIFYGALDPFGYLCGSFND